MREILFKEKLKDRNQWIEGFYCSMRETTYCCAEDYERHPVPLHHLIVVDEMTDWGLPNKLRLYEIDPETLCQCTGLRDKNGRLIFEHDILEARLDKCFPEDITHVEVAWTGFCWALKEDHGCDTNVMDESDGEIWEVVGNTIDNPELLREEAQT